MEWRINLAAKNWSQTAFASPDQTSRTQPIGERGFVLFQTLIILPLALACFGFFIVFGKKLVDRDKNQDSCRKNLLAAQQHLKNDLKSILNLNPLAKKLRKQRVQAAKLLRTATATGQPELIAVASLNFKKIILQQIELDREQKHILRHASHIRRIALKNFKAAHPKLEAQLFTSPQNKSGLAVSPLQTFDIAPEYRTLLNFEQHQALHLAWKEKFISTESRPIFFDQPKDKTQAICGTTLKSKGQTWALALQKGK